MGFSQMFGLARPAIVSVQSNMNISRAEQSVIRHNMEEYRLQQIRLEKQGNEDYRKVVETRQVERIIAERVSRNLRLDLDRGRHIDVEC
jgi:hypothetical protein